MVRFGDERRQLAVGHAPQVAALRREVPCSRWVVEFAQHAAFPPPPGVIQGPQPRGEGALPAAAAVGAATFRGPKHGRRGPSVFVLRDATRALRQSHPPRRCVLHQVLCRLQRLLRRLVQPRLLQHRVAVTNGAQTARPRRGGVQQLLHLLQLQAVLAHDVGGVGAVAAAAHLEHRPHHLTHRAQLKVDVVPQPRQCPLDLGQPRNECRWPPCRRGAGVGGAAAGHAHGNAVATLQPTARGTVYERERREAMA